MCVFFFLHDLFDFGENAGIESFVASLILEGRLKDSIPFAFFFCLWNFHGHWILVV